MLRWNDGVFSLGKAFQRPNSPTMSGLEGITTFATGALRSTTAMQGGARAFSPATGCSNPSSPQYKAWRPSYGIVFKSRRTLETPRLMSCTASAELVDNMASKSDTEDSHVLADTRTAEKFAVKDQSGGLLHDPVQDGLPQSTGVYNMTEETFHAAKGSADISLDSCWSHTLYRGPIDEETGLPKRVRVHYCKSTNTTESVLQKHFVDKKIIGFDIEWKAEANKNSGIKKNVSLIQIASEERIALFHVALYSQDKPEDLVAPSLRKIMEDSEITKVGVSIKADCTRLRKYLGVNCQGLFELSHLHRLVKFSESKDFKSINKKLVSLASQVQEHLHLPMFKGVEVRSSDWSKALNLDQITYAASDSYAGYQLYKILEIKREAMFPTPPRPFHADLNKPIRLAEGVEILVDETAEELEPEELEPSTKSNQKLRLSKIPQTPESLGIMLELEDPDADFRPPPDLITPHSSPLRIRPKGGSKPPQPQKSPALLAAEELTATYRAETSTSTSLHRATPANLRAYYLWDRNPRLSLPEVAALLRTPPLQTRTVAHYILEAVKLENLKFENPRLRDVLCLWKAAGEPRGMMSKRYWKIEKEVGWEQSKEARPQKIIN